MSFDAETQYFSAVHWKVGSCVVTALSDGYFQIPMAQFITGVRASEIERVRQISHRESHDRIDINAYLIRGGGRSPVLVDAGTGSGLVPTAGRLQNGLRSIGVAPEEIGTVLLTHLHGDHCGGLADGTGKAIFPDAEVVVSANEAHYWLTEDRAQVADKGAAALARAALDPYKNRLRLIEEGEVAPNLFAIPLLGHTPGHTGYRLDSDGDSLLIWGDVLNAPTVQSILPGAGVISDVNSEQAAETRSRILDHAARENLLVAGMHTEFPGIVQVISAHEGFRLVPASWSSYQ